MRNAVVRKSIRLSEAEARGVADYVGMVGGTEAALLKEAALRGLREIRLSRGVLAFIEGASSSEAAQIAGMPRAPFLHELMERGVHVLRGPVTLEAELEAFFAAEEAAQREP
jgi:predicted HTH domain antitoxin